MDDQNKNLILATALSFAVILVWFLLFPPPEPVEDPNAAAVTAEATQPVATTPAATAAAGATPTTAETSEQADAPRLAIETDRLSGSISLLGGRLDDLKLKDYREELAEDSPIVTFLSPKGQPHAYYALYGWAPGSGLDLDTVPGPNTIWSVEGKGLDQQGGATEENTTLRLIPLGLEVGYALDQWQDTIPIVAT